MKGKQKLVLLALGSALLGVLPAQDKMPEQPAALEFLLGLEGKWQATATMKSREKSSTFQYFSDFRRTADGHGLVMDESAELPDMGKMQGTNLIGYAPFDGNIHWFSVDNMGTAHDHVGKMVDKDHFRMVHHSTREGKEYHEDIDVIRKGPKEVSLKVVSTLDGKVQETVEGVFVEVGKNANSKITD
jgi:hypothetical protein